MSSTKKYKYKLSSEEGIRNGTATCAFFGTEKGCKNGSNCPFSHEIPLNNEHHQHHHHQHQEENEQLIPRNNARMNNMEDTKKRKEQQYNNEEGTPQKKKKRKKKNKDTTNNTKQQNKNNNNNNNELNHQIPKQKGTFPVSVPMDSNQPAKPGSFASLGRGEVIQYKNPFLDNHIQQQQQQRQENHSSNETDDESPSSSSSSSSSFEDLSDETEDEGDHVETPRNRRSSQTKLPSISATTATAHNHNNNNTTTPSYMKLNLPVAPYNPSNQTRHSSDEQQQTPQTERVRASTSPPPPRPPPPLPQSTPGGRKWLDAVLETRSHPLFESDFNFDKVKTRNIKAGICRESDWIKARPFGAWCQSNPSVIAIDCEMCACRNPQTGAVDDKALCRLSVVNGEDPDDVLLDTLVRPPWPVTDYRTTINGITKDDLKNVSFTLEHAQAFFMELCSDQTVIVGHAVHNDLHTLRMEHYCVVDSAYLFCLVDEPPTASPSLRDLAIAVFQKDMPQTHDSVNDARTALECLEVGYLAKNGQPDLIQRSSPPRKKSSSFLLIHRIPKICQPEDISRMFLDHTYVQPLDNPDVVIEFPETTTKTTTKEKKQQKQKQKQKQVGKLKMEFLSRNHADLAFNTLSGKAEPDKTGRLQKKVYLKNGDYIQVRKMYSKRK